MTYETAGDNLFSKETVDNSRRTLLKGGLAAMLVACAPPFIGTAHAARQQPGRAVSLVNLHTGDKLRATYWEHGHYVHDALIAINHVLRDHRTGQVHKMDPQLLDLLYSLHKRVDSNQPFQIISGYRSPVSNAMMHERSNGVAKKSMHVEGKAVDIRVGDCCLKNLRKAAISLKRGGVGYYPSSQFVHVDTGKIRYW